jgi:hypothetical protein
LKPACASTDLTNIISREEALEQGLARFYTGKPCVRGHAAPRFVSSKACVVCARENQNKWNGKNSDKLRQYVAKYDSNHRGRRCEAAREYRKNSPDKANAATQRYRKRNQGLVNAHCSARRAAQLSATPRWVDRKKLQDIYRQAKEMSTARSCAYQVDHIVPLKHELVCGLHVPWNLQIISASENRRKKNRYNVG